VPSNVAPKLSTPRLKKVEALPEFETSVLPAYKRGEQPKRWGDSIECDEMWAFVGSKKNQQWIWLAWSYQTTQVLSFAVGPRDMATGREMWEGIPAGYRKKQNYTDGLKIYDALIPYEQHWVAEKGTGATNVAEGCNNYLRHRVSYLVRKSMSFARNVEWLKRRLEWVLYARNERIKTRWETQER
jgi:insertion element IS1 protein InsB